ncbi:insulinase family protein [Proteiniborus sp. MB09-C3]|uniref:insulinase family protein n=1 Tax=Proteiniborus sp. MB09-C3 TaxID=3050072 RepID=UPI0025542A17|nr:insulinase family protein [Proteiniborus sp. MB09-C3]WIV12754.1 insulinase family protein [Proteiniborus sp. MB09-C3]
MFEVNKIYNGFKLIQESKIDELQSVGRLFYHEKSGARLLHLENEDDNKVFSIGFRTPPTDDTGVPHILEHCVLAGSRKYTTKEPFMDMVKGSLQTFINAMTFSDKTVYPVASRNEKDFYNLMDVYLDAVFYPQIYELPEIFMQEGWHHEIFNKEDNITYKGVVYNEMKGAYSTPETILMEAVSRSLFPDTCYRYSSGGDPDAIPDLTHESFLNFHSKLYHPSNSYIFLYGDGDIEKQLAYIDENYLSNFDKIEVNSHIKRQEPFASKRELTNYYNISSDDNPENKTYLSMNFVLGDNSDLESYLMNDIISKILIDSQAAPLKKALIDAGIGEDIFVASAGGLQYGMGIVAKNTSIDKKEEFEDVIFKTLNKLVEEGIDKELIEASINVVEYDLREASGFATKGIMYKIRAMDSWLYDGNPIEHLKYDETIKKLRENIQSDYFEEYIKEKFINNNHSSLVIIEPKKGLAEEKEKTLQEKLNGFKNSLSEKELEKLIGDNVNLRNMQLSDDTEEAKATIPKLAISDVNPKAEVIPQEVIRDDEFTILFHDIFTSKIAYLDLYFDSSIIEEKYIPYMNLLAELLGKMDTKYKSYGELSNSIYVSTGGIKFNTEALIKEDNIQEFIPKFIVSGKAIGDNITTLISLMAELILDTKLEDHNRIKELLLQIKSRMEMNIFRRGNSVATSRVGSYFSAPWRYVEKLKGLDFFWFISDLAENFDNKKDEIVTNLNYVYNKIFNLNNLIVSFTGDNDDLTTVRDNLDIITERLNKDIFTQEKYSFSEEKLNEGILSNSNVQYVAKGYDFKKLGYEYHGSMRVLETILNGDYLHNRVRAQGGAYGVGISLERAGHLTVYSYRDPNLKETLSVYDNMADYISKLELNDTELTQFIIGAIARLEPAMTPYRKGQIQANRYIINITMEDIQEIRNEVLSTNIERIKSFVPLLNDTMKEEYICVLGNENKIKENERVFNNFVKLMK